MSLFGKLFDTEKNSNSEFPFSDAKNAATITCCHIMNDGHAILYAAHDEDDGMWQFLCGKVHETGEAMIVALEEVFNRDNSIAAVVKLPYGYEAERKDKRTEWIVRKK